MRFIEWRRYRGTAIPGKQIIGKELPENLYHKMVAESVGQLFSTLPFFNGVSSSFITVLCKHIATYFYCEGDIIKYQV